MTSLITYTLRHASFVAAFAGSFCMFSTSSSAFGPEARQMCMGDAFRLCSAEIPNISAITACMITKRTSLSPGCRTVVDREVAQMSHKVTSNAGR